MRRQSASRLVLIGVAQAGAAVLFEVPAGVAGLVTVGGLAWVAGPGRAMVSAGAAMLLLGVFVAVRFPERRFVATTSKRILSRGFQPVRHSRVLVTVFTATFLVSGVSDAFGRLYPLRLIAVGPALDPFVWFTGLGVLMCLAGAAALRIVQPWISGPHTVRRGYLVACAVAAIGVSGLAVAPDAAGGSAAVVLASGALPLTRGFGSIWVNGQTTSAVRATVHSLLAQAEYAGKIVCGLAVAAFTGTFPALTACAALLALAVVVVRRSSPGPVS